MLRALVVALSIVFSTMSTFGADIASGVLNKLRLCIASVNYKPNFGINYHLCFLSSQDKMQVYLIHLSSGNAFRLPDSDKKAPEIMEYQDSRVIVYSRKRGKQGSVPLI